MTTFNLGMRGVCVLAAASITACGGSSGGGGGARTKLECAEISGAQALLLSKLTGTKNDSSTFGTKALEEAGSYSENPLQPELFSKLSFATSAGPIAVDELSPDFLSDQVRFIDVDNDTAASGDDLGDYTFAIIPGYQSELFLIRKQDNAIISVGLDNLGFDFERPFDEAPLFQAFNLRGDLAYALSDRQGNVYIGGLPPYVLSYGFETLPIIRISATELASALPGDTVQGVQVSLDGDDRLVLLGVDSELGILSYQTSSQDGSNRQTRVVNLSNNGFRNVESEPFSLAGSTYAIASFVKENNCPQSRFEEDSQGLRLLRVGPSSESVVDEALLECANFDSGVGLFPSAAPYVRLGYTYVTSRSYDNEGNSISFDDFYSPVVVSPSSITPLVEIGKAIENAFDQRYENYNSFGYYLSIRCSPNVCLGLANGDGWIFDPRSDNADSVQRIDGVAIRSYYPGNSTINFDGNRFSDGQRAIGEVDSDGNVTYKAEIATEVVEYVPLRKANNDPTSCVSSAR